MGCTPEISISSLCVTLWCMPSAHPLSLYLPLNSSYHVPSTSLPSKTSEGKLPVLSRIAPLPSLWKGLLYGMVSYAWSISVNLSSNVFACTLHSSSAFSLLYCILWTNVASLHYMSLSFCDCLSLFWHLLSILHDWRKTWAVASIISLNNSRERGLYRVRALLARQRFFDAPYRAGNLSPAMGRGISSRNRVWNWVANT